MQAGHPTKSIMNSGERAAPEQTVPLDETQARSGSRPGVPRQSRPPREPHRLYALKHGDCFAVADSYGDIREVGDGFFKDDTRILSSFRMLIGGKIATSLLGASSVAGQHAVHCHLTNLAVPAAGGDMPRGVVHIERGPDLRNNRCTSA